MKLDKNECNYLDVSRFIGIYLVIFAHFMLTFHYQYLADIAFSFHMPLFFIVAGILERHEPFSTKLLKNLTLSLIVPYAIYNLLGAAYLLLANGESLADVGTKLLNTFTLLNPITGASWFLVSLFWTKIMFSFLNKKKAIIIAILCIVFTIVCDQFVPRFPYDNIFVIRTSITAFPFLVAGYLLKDVLLREMKTSVRILLILLLGGINIALVLSTGSMSIAMLSFGNVYTAYIMAFTGSLALFLFSQLILPWVKCNFVKDVSRGTMMIVGTHVFVMFSMFPNIFFGVMPLRKVVLLSILLLLVFYVIIKLTYNRLPILYGKWRR